MEIRYASGELPDGTANVVNRCKVDFTPITVGFISMLDGSMATLAKCQILRNCDVTGLRIKLV